MRLDRYIRLSTEALSQIYPEEEASRTVLVLLMHFLGIKNYTPITEPSLEVDEKSLDPYIKRLLASEPLQYVTGRAQFCGRNFNVGPGVLIPRPETEELVEYARPFITPSSRILDLCTGSGCIAWTVALDYPSATVCAVDISPEALAIARSQFDGQSSGSCPHPEWLTLDVLDSSSIPDRQFDVILANPPYVLDSQRKDMRPNVLDWEPQSAIFVSDDDPLVFYRAFISWARKCLAPGGRFFAETNDVLSDETAALYTDAGFGEVSVLKDISGRDRFVSFAVSKK